MPVLSTCNTLGTAAAEMHRCVDHISVDPHAHTVVFVGFSRMACHPAQTAVSAAVELDQSRAVAIDTGVSPEVAYNTLSATDSSTNGDCIVPMCKNSFGQSAFSVKGAKPWNSLPMDLKLETDGNVFNRGVKLWLKSNRPCSHE